MSDTRQVIESRVEEETGIGFNQLKEFTGLSNGVIQHHVKNSEVLEKRREAIVHSEKCRSCKFRDRCEKTCLQKILHKENYQKVLELKKEGKDHVEIAEELDRDESTISYYVNRLKELNILEE